MKSNKLKCWLAAVVVAVICCPAALAQQSKIAVASFNRMETDITARVTAPKKDQNGEVCALIRIVTNVKDLMFEPDALGITARENKIGEIWLYVPRGARRISILHDQLGILRNYFYPDIKDEEDLGLYFVEELGALDIPDNLRAFFDFETYGRCLAMEGGAFTDGGYIEGELRGFVEVYSGREDIPEEHRIFAYPEPASIRETLQTYRDLSAKPSETERPVPAKAAER